tara:strand:- start:28 stop:540 length:513 start_codon:yes stop_codon:yes gene_type:complete
MKKISIYLLTFFIVFSSVLLSEEKNKIDSDHQYNFFIGNFDFSDHKQAALMVGFQHQNESLERESFIGNISPITGGFITENSGAYIYTGIEWNMNMGGLLFTPSFSPGLYHAGDGKDLNHILEFKTEVQLSFAFSENSNIAMSYNHISNGNLAKDNPGANNYAFNFLKKF